MQKNNKQNIRIDGVNVTLNNVADLINNGKIVNLLHIRWVDLFKNVGLLPDWSVDYHIISYKDITAIIDKIDNNAMKIRVIESIEKDFNKNLLDAGLFNDDVLTRELSLLSNIKQDIADYEYFCLENVKCMSNSIKQNDLLEKILNKTVEKGFAQKNGSHYKWLKPQSYLAVFADVLNEKGYTKNKFSEIETLFGVKRLAQTLCRTLDQKNEPEIRAKIKMLFN